MNDIFGEGRSSATRECKKKFFAQGSPLSIHRNTISSIYQELKDVECLNLKLQPIHLKDFYFMLHIGISISFNSDCAAIQTLYSLKITQLLILFIKKVAFNGYIYQPVKTTVSVGYYSEFC